MSDELHKAHRDEARRVADDLLEKLAARMRECDELREENNELHDLNFRLSALLTGVADALKGTPERDTAHSWHDLPELTEALRTDDVTQHAALAGIVNAYLYPHQFEPDKLKPAQSEAALRAGMALGAHRNLVEWLSGKRQLVTEKQKAQMMQIAKDKGMDLS